MTPKPPPPRKRIIIAHHLVLMGYAHWLPNDIRGSGSDEIRKELLGQLGDIHHGRNVRQPARAELRAFHRSAEPLLEQRVIWFDDRMREIIARSFATTAAQFRYTIWACAVLRNHAHLVVARHKHNHDVIWRTFAEGSAQELRTACGLPQHHRIWGQRPFSKFLHTPDEIISRIAYVNENPIKEGLAPQGWACVVPYSRPIGQRYNAAQESVR